MTDSRLKKFLNNSEKTFFFLTILFLPTQLGKHFWPEFSFVYSLRIDYLSPVIYFWDLLVLGLIGTVATQAILKKGKVRLNKTFFALYLVFLITQSVSGFFAVNPEATLVRLKEYIIAGLLALYVASKDFAFIKHGLYYGLLFSVLFTCLLSISQFLLGHSIGLWVLGERSFSVTTPLIARFNFYENVFLRPYATFPHPNLLAAFLILSLSLLIFAFSEKLKSLRLILGVLVTGTVFITFSRPGLILIAIQSFLMFKRLWKIWLILLVLITPLIVVRLASVFTFDTLAVLRRRELSDFALKLFYQNPLFGVGLNNFVNELASEKVLVGTSRFLQPVHNIFLLVLSETGLVGFFGIMLIFATATFKNILTKDKFSKVLLGNLLMVVFLGVFDHYFLTLPQGQRILFLILGLSFNKKSAKAQQV